MELPGDFMFSKATVIVCVGSGGVGKTTIASALGFLAAEKGRRVLVLTVDPSRRLKTTMGIGERDEVTRVAHPALEKGELWAAVINPKKTFDEFILRASKYSKSAEKLLTNKLYISLSTTLSGSQEFTALEKLYANFESGRFDLIVLDTPPTKHAIDFLDSPQKLSMIFHESIAKWFRAPEGSGLLSKILHGGTQKVLKALELLTGSLFMQQLSEFFRDIEGWQEKLEGRITQVHQLLIAKETEFVLVTSLDEAKLKEASYFHREIKKGGYHLGALLINRAVPAWISQRQEELNAQVQANCEFENSYLDYYRNRLKTLERVELDVPSIVKIPELRENISDLNGVMEMAKELDKAKLFC